MATKIVDLPIATATAVLGQLFTSSNGTSGAAPFLSDDLGYRAVRIRRRSTDPRVDNVVRTQVQGLRTLAGTEHKMSAMNGQLVAYALRLIATGSGWGAFCNLFSWTSFLSGTSGSGSVGINPNPNYQIHAHFGTTNPNYGTRVDCLIPQPTQWTDFVVLINYSKSETVGWVEVYRKISTTATWEQRPWENGVLRCVGRTLGESLSGDNNRYGLYSSQAFNGEAGLAICAVYTGSDAKQAAFDRFGESTPPPPPPDPLGDPPAPPPVSPGFVGDGTAELNMGTVAGARTGDMKQAYVFDAGVELTSLRKVDIPLGQSSHRFVGLTNAKAYTFRASAGQPGSYGPWTPDAQVVTMTPNVSAPLPSGVLFQRPNTDVSAVAGQTWTRASTGRGYWEHVSRAVSRQTPATDPAFTDGDTLSVSASGRILELGFSTFTRPSTGFAQSVLCVNLRKTGALGVELRARTAPAGAQTLVGSVIGVNAQPQQTYEFALPQTLVDTQSELDGLQLELRTSLPGGASGGDVLVYEVWVEHVAAPDSASDITASPTSLTFAAVQGADPATQPVALSAATATAFTVADDMPWASVTPNQLTTPATLTVAPSGAGLSPGVRSGTITVTDPLGRTDTIAVTFTLTSAVDLVATPTTLAFPSRAVNEPPVTLNVDIANAGGIGDVSFSVEVDQPWLSVSPAAADAPARIRVSADPAGLAVGLKTGEMTILGASETILLPITFTVLEEIPGEEPPPEEPPFEPGEKYFYGSGWPAASTVTILPRLSGEPADMREMRDLETGETRVVLISRPAVSEVTTDAYGNFEARLTRGPYWAVALVDGTYRYVAITVE